MSDFLHKGLNPKQKEAVLNTEGPLLIIAGPGSGKTFTLVERVVYLIKEKGASPESLFVVTFTEKAARELKTRVSNRLAELEIPFNLHEMYLGTFHSICLKILDEYRDASRLERNYSVMDQFDQQYFLYQNIKKYQAIENSDLIMGSRTSNWNQSENLLKWLNKLSEEAVDIKTFHSSGDVEIRALAELYDLYHNELKDNNTLDFSTIQYDTLRLLEDNPDIREELQEHLKYLMIDEYQDTNTIQEKIARLLMGERKNICVVGDDDQGLYRFRGATIRNILQFKDNFEPGACKEVDLTINYRSHPDIVKFYNEWQADKTWEVDGTSFRFDKNIIPCDKEFKTNPSVIKVSSEEGDSWHEEVHLFLSRLVEEKRITNWNQVAFLFRSVKNDKVLALSRYLEDKGIPVYSPRSNMFFEREEIRLMIGAFIFMFPQFPKVRQFKINGKDHHLEVWDYYDRMCAAPFFEELRKPENKELLDWCRSVARDHMRLVKDTDYGYTGLFYRLLQFPLFSRFLREEDRSIERIRATRNYSLFSQILTRFEYLHYVSVFKPQYLDKNIKDLFNSYFRFLIEGGIDEYEDDSEYAPSGCVSFLTIHQSKGLEFPIVFVGSLEAVPRKQYTDLDEKIEQGYLSKEIFEPLEHTKYFDFWRLYYTAFSRAQNLLVLSCGEKTGNGRTPSKYFSRYYDKVISWKDPSFSIKEVDAEEVKEINIKNEYSFTSHINLYDTCPQQYRFFKELAFAPVRTAPMIFGTIVHQTIEDIHNAALSGNEDIINEKKIEEWFNHNYKLISKTERVLLAPHIEAVALDHVIRYFKSEQDKWFRIREAEIDISLVMEDFILKGSIDLVRGEDNTVEIVDFKSETKPDIETESERLEKYQKQLEIYAHLFEERTGQKVSKLHLYYTGEKSGTPYISFDKSSESIDGTVSDFSSVVRRIENKDFKLKRPPGTECVDCDMKYHCGKKNFKFEG
ncbi:MAG: DNA helicase UvrD [Halobacteriovorax sp.]|nr:DNA helicase UvrD [Halobacteriovorax sp.]|tara:strand:- start:344997 stop:347891 length:2895 start_codon:yes stop_codon:yes gene_type:complete